MFSGTSTPSNASTTRRKNRARAARRQQTSVGALAPVHRPVSAPARATRVRRGVTRVLRADAGQLRRWRQRWLREPDLLKRDGLL